MEEPNLYLEIGIKLSLGILAILLYAMIKVRDHLLNFSFRILINENRPFWIWCISVMLIILLIVTISPGAAGAIKSFTGLDVSDEPTSFLTLGWALAVLSNGAVKKKIDQKDAP